MYQTSSSGTQTRTCTYGCLPTSQSCTASQCVNDTCTTWSACGGCTPATGSCTCTGTQTCTASIYGCLVNTTRSCTYTSPDGTTCATGKICHSGQCCILTCTPVAGTGGSYGFDSKCNWGINNTYKWYTSSGSYPVDTTYCVPQGATCSSYSGGWTGCTDAYKYGYQCVGTTNLVCNGIPYCSTITTGGGTMVYSATCLPMTGCNATYSSCQ